MIVAIFYILIDERWLEWLDSKMALLINRSGVDPRDYGGKSYDEYVGETIVPPCLLIVH